MTAFALELATSVSSGEDNGQLVGRRNLRELTWDCCCPFHPRTPQRDLQLFLLRSAQARPISSPAATPATSSTATEGSPSRTTDDDVDLEPFLRIASDLLLLFHAHWQQGGYTVMRESLLKQSCLFASFA